LSGILLTIFFYTEGPYSMVARRSAEPGRPKRHSKTKEVEELLKKEERNPSLLLREKGGKGHIHVLKRENQSKGGG